MIKVREALNIILNSIKPLESEWVSISCGLDRAIATDIWSKSNLPAFDNSAMDGYALRAKDTKGASGVKPKVFEVIEDVPAGYWTKRYVGDDQAARIMTGAPLSKGADSVVMVEFTKKIRSDKKDTKELVKVFKEVKKSENVRKRGEDVRRGQKVLSRGCIIRPQELGMLAALGINKIKVTKRPRVGVLATGDELVGVGERLTKGKIRNSNSYILNAQITKCGGLPLDFGIVRDTQDEVKDKIQRALKRNLDMLLVVGGISVGDYDLVKDVLAKLGIKMKFWQVAMRPGKPLAFGLIQGIPVFGLPGNPVSSTVAFEEFVRPAILKMQQAENLFRPQVLAILAEELRKKKGFRYFVRAKIKNKNGVFYASATGPQGSGLISSLVLADGIIVIPEDIVVLKKGQAVYVQLLRHGYDGGVV